MIFLLISSVLFEGHPNNDDDNNQIYDSNFIFASKLGQNDNIWLTHISTTNLFTEIR